MCGGAFIIVFVCAYVRGERGAPTANRDNSLRVGLQGDVWWLEIENGGGGGSGAGGKSSMGRGAG